MLAYSKIVFLSSTELSFLACYEYGFGRTCCGIL